MLDIIMGYECNLRCDYCTISARMRKNNLATDQILEKITHARSLGMHKVSFGGGEPTIRRDLLPLIRLCRDRGFDYIKVQSNGFMYSYENFTRSMIENGVTHFHVTIKTFKPDLYDKITGKKGSLKLVTKGLTNLINLGQSPYLDIIMKNDTFLHLAETIEHFAKIGVKNFILWLVSLTDANKNHIESLPRVSELKPEMFRAFELSKKLGVSSYSRHIPLCMLKGYEDFVWNLREDRVMVVTPGDTFFLWESAISANTYAEKCKSCSHYNGRCMGIRNDYLERFGDEEVSPA
jgi:cyclic pyranopterin phosphate synthase